MRDAIEIERKFLVRREALPPLGPGQDIAQAYLGFAPVVRIRLAGEHAYLTVKGEGLRERREVETAIDRAAARALLEMRVRQTKLIRKTRHGVTHAGRVWEVDVFRGELEGLILAEAELDSEEEALALPPWVDREVTEDPGYQNANLARHGAPKPPGGRG